MKALSQIIDPDFGTDIVSCGFVKDLHVNEASGEVILNMAVISFMTYIYHVPTYHLNFTFQVSFRLELTTPACPVKDMVNDPQQLMYVSIGRIFFPFH